MKTKSTILIVAALMLLSVFFTGCGGTGPLDEMNESQVPGNQPAEGEVSSGLSADLPSGKTVTDLKQIEGTWIAPAYPGNFVLTIFPDGKLSVATSLEDLQAGSTDTWQLALEDGEITATGYALCLGDVGSYIATLNEDGTLRFTSIIDPCDARLRKMDRSLPGRLNEYILIYHPVE